MHSHSGQFCPGHAKNQLEEVVQHAISVGYTTMGLTEHMPRTTVEDLYPEEMDDPAASLSVLFPRHEAYLLEAQRMQKKYADKIHILIGFEGEWIRPDYGPLIKQLADEPAVDYFIGSLHHTCGIPIDYDRQTYDRAIAAVFKNRGVDDIEDIGYDDREKALYETYYDEQYELLTALKPRVIGHFDLVCLLSIKPSRDIKALWPDVWDKVVRNLKAVVEYGGWLECNTSGLRKGLDTPYPSRNIAEEFLGLGGRFTFSDDSHGIAQIGTNYRRGVDYLDSLGVKTVWTWKRTVHPGIEDRKRSGLVEREVSLEEFRKVFH